MTQLYKTAAILLGMIGIFATNTRGQIVSYRDDTGKTVYINSDPKPAKRVATPSTAKPLPSLVAGFKPISTRTMGTPATMNQSANERAAQAQSLAENPNQTIVQSSRSDIAQMVREVSARYHVDPELIEAVVETESHGNPSAVSNRGAQGLMQLIPETAFQMGVKNPLDPQQNLDGGVRYLQMLLQRYNGDLDKALAAYNAGPGAVDRAGGVPRFRETRAYVQKVTNSYYRPGSDRLAGAFSIRARIYRAVDPDGRVVFTNE
jgi:soluble lytic murein transglycosylase-like protein